MILNLPYPPSINHYYRYGSKPGAKHITAKGKAFRTAVGWIVKAAKADVGEAGRVSVSVQIWTPDKRKRDIDNVLKALLDALTHANVYKDDCQIDKLFVTRKGTRKGGACIVSVDTIFLTQDEADAKRWALDNCS